MSKIGLQLFGMGLVIHENKILSFEFLKKNLQCFNLRKSYAYIFIFDLQNRRALKKSHLCHTLTFKIAITKLLLLLPMLLLLLLLLYFSVNKN